ncbi:UNVERIFIED_CONTAM: Retrovirus-related Pol polyprotein from type-2 retrotransposable element R2DM, partial [Sesamum indicum]
AVQTAASLPAACCLRLLPAACCTFPFLGLQQTAIAAHLLPIPFSLEILPWPSQRKAKQQADASTAGQPKTAGPPPAADEPAQSTKPATKQGTTTAAGKVTKNAAAIATDNRPVGKLPVTENVEKKPVSFAGLFSANRKLTNEHKLTKFAVDDGPLTLVSDDLLDVRAKLGFCLVGYVAGKFPGLKVIRTLAQSWGASFQQHESGCTCRTALNSRKMISASRRSGPHFHRCPLECWHPNALGKIGSRIGTPIAMDSLTMNMERVSYARILVEVDASKKLIEQVEFVMPNGITRKQPVLATDLGICSRLAKAYRPLPPQPPQPLPPPVAAPIKPAEAAKSKPGDWMVVNRRSKGKATATAAKPAVETQRPTSPPAGKVEQGRLNMKAPQPVLLKDKQGRIAIRKSRQEGISPSITMKIGFWNVRGFNRPLKHNGVAHLIKNNRLCLLGILETKLAASSIQTILSRSLPGWCQANNFDTIAGGRILVVWDPAIIDIHPVDISPQVIHCRATNKSSQLSFYISFTYGLYSVVNRRNMWEKLSDFGQSRNMPWLIMGDFNCVKSPNEKQLGRLDYTMFPLPAATTLGIPTMKATPYGASSTGVLCNNAWLEGGLHCSAHFNPPGCLSDHSPGIVSILDPAPTKPKSFRFFNMWADHPDFLATVEAKWNLSVDGTAQFCLCKRLKALKGELKAFNSQHYSHISARAKEADHTLQVAQNQLESNPGDVALRNSLGDLRKRAVFLAEAERQFFYQKAKIHYLKDGDRNTKFFHDMVKRNVTKNSIGAVTRADGTVITAAEDIAQEFAHTLPVDDGVFEWGPILSPEQTADLCRAVTPLEVKEAIFHISDNKAPGPDGYSSCFFKKAWNIVGDQVCRAVLDFFRCGRMLRQLNHTIIALVPKSDHSTHVADYRPISCCNVIYKAITKIISDRLAPVLEHLIDRCQAAFVGGRNITDNIFLAQEMVRQYSRKRISPRCTINVDLRKAFDSVSWSFLGRVLHGYGFPPLFINWIMECVCNSSFSVALNGSLRGFFPGKKGLRQGDPMSPALFLLCMEYFSRLVKRKTTNSDFNFHPKCEKLKITHLLFADDLMLFSRGDLPSIHILMECLQEFRDTSGLTINTSKSSIFTAGIQYEELDGILARTGFARGEMPVRYLGIPLAAQRLTVTNYSPLVDHIADCISKWTGKSLSYAGRLELIRSVIQGVECFWLQVFPLPAAVIEKIHRLCRNFLWNSRRTPVAWEEICHPKEEGGLGIRHIQSWNVALLARVLWNIHRKADTLWVQWVNGVYLRDASIWDWQPKKGDSPLLQRLAEIRNKVVTEFGSSEAAIEQMTRWSTPKGLQTSKAYEYFRPKLARQPWKAAIWKAFIPPKYSFILWLGLRGRLATRDRLGFLQEEDLCSLCINTKESAKHLFFECPFSNFVWSRIRHWLGINRTMSTLQSAVKWLKKEKTGSSVQNKARHLALACTVYTLWRQRNEIIFEGSTACPERLVNLVKVTLFRVLWTLFPHGFDRS